MELARLEALMGRVAQTLTAGLVAKHAPATRWVVFRTRAGLLAGREVLDEAYTSKKWMRIAVRTPWGRKIVLRDIVRDEVQRLNRPDELAYREGHRDILCLLEEIRNLHASKDVQVSPGGATTGEMDMD